MKSDICVLIILISIRHAQKTLSVFLASIKW
uniref:Uncharacterized protein n=1 Tax=Arundo donax TaxID=35708 RepID=A0A0A9BAD5_ARUDO